MKRHRSSNSSGATSDADDGDVSPRKCAYKRMQMSGDDPPEDSLSSNHAAQRLTRALEMRHQYMDLLGGRFSSTTLKFLDKDFLQQKDLDEVSISTDANHLLANIRLQHQRTDHLLSKVKRTSAGGEERSCQVLSQACAVLANLERDLLALPPLTATPGSSSQKDDADTKKNSANHSVPSESEAKPQQKYRLTRRNGVVAFVSEETGQIPEEFQKFYVDKNAFLEDLETLMDFVHDLPLRAFSNNRLKMLDHRFGMHVLSNGDEERRERKNGKKRDYHNCTKVDTHIHAASSMTVQHLMRFLVKKAKGKPGEPDEVIDKTEDGSVTLKQFFELNNIDVDELTADMVGMHSDKNHKFRWDKFDESYTPCGLPELRNLLLRYENYVGGRYFAELLKEVFGDLEQGKYQFAEPRISIHGRKPEEWDVLAKWALDNEVALPVLNKDKDAKPHVRLMVQFPRKYHSYKESAQLVSFDSYLDNIFRPLFEVTNDPETHPKLHEFLQLISGFDTFDKNMPEPANYIIKDNPPYAYYMFYYYANLVALNAFRKHRGFNTFEFRPHCGEAGQKNHMACGFLLADNINHGVELGRAPVLQYLYYLAQIGISMSPMSNNHLFMRFDKNPFKKFFERGQRVCLSTDDPLQFHKTKEPLAEEYSVVQNIYNLSTTDMCELARNSVLISGFEKERKCEWLGDNYAKEGVDGNDIEYSNVPNIRVAFRQEVLESELDMLFRASRR